MKTLSGNLEIGRRTAGMPVLPAVSRMDADNVELLKKHGKHNTNDVSVDFSAELVIYTLNYLELYGNSDLKELPRFRKLDFLEFFDIASKIEGAVEKHKEVRIKCVDQLAQECKISVKDALECFIMLYAATKRGEEDMVSGKVKIPPKGFNALDFTIEELKANKGFGTSQIDLLLSEVTLEYIERIKARELMEAQASGVMDVEEVRNATTFSLSKNEVSRLHHLPEIIVQVSEDTEEEAYLNNCALMLDAIKVAVPFVVKHDWLALLGDVITPDTEVRLPYPICAFEFLINGCSLTLVLIEHGPILRAFCIVVKKSAAAWEVKPNVKTDTFTVPIYQYALNQAKAICIALEAKVAESQQVVASKALNKKRVANHKTPLRDYHVVDLSKQLNRPKVSVATGTGTRKRLHFRRGHWGTFGLDKHKTWIEWQLVGDPDLGFIDKHYKV